MRLRDRVAIVTGAAGGLGSAISERFAQEGASLCLADRNSTAATAAAVRSLGREAVEVLADVTQTASVNAMVAQALVAFGRIDILVNVAGVSSHGAAATLPEAEWDRVLNHNLKSVFLCTQAVVAPMRERRYGRIVSIGSILGKNGGNPRPWIDPSEQVRAGNVAYGASKAGIHAMTFYFAKELAADGITVNVVAPGPIASPMTTNFPDTLRGLIPVGRMGTAVEVADAVTFLAGEAASFVTGEVLDVNGGAWCD
ncbi:SDR family NAD(P)-dependent oxidoreductase [Acidisphaera sp. S103]|uniref:SDR family NAD(P)-dependent oxidoreductase n=1 Tax=Acidisphaera sp. S103 TaxID=1747223 RepID=UPI00131C3082|nr:SDR family NAD(P)-dependent oxidoreductase [Acidisphaera sp. S103]